MQPDISDVFLYLILPKLSLAAGVMALFFFVAHGAARIWRKWGIFSFDPILLLYPVFTLASIQAISIGAAAGGRDSLSTLEILSFVTFGVIYCYLYFFLQARKRNKVTTQESEVLDQSPSNLMRFGGLFLDLLSIVASIFIIIFFLGAIVGLFTQ